MIDEKKLAELRKFMPGDDYWTNINVVVTKREILDTIEALWKIARAAEKIIYAPRTEYAPGSKKANLKAALDCLALPTSPVPEENHESR